MTIPYRLTPAADQDLVEIWSSTREQWGAKQADKYLLELESCFIELTRFPDLGKERPEIRPGYRAIPKNKHVVFYRRNQNQIEIIRILHMRMDIVDHIIQEQ